MIKMINKDELKLVMKLVQRGEIAIVDKLYGKEMLETIQAKFCIKTGKLQTRQEKRNGQTEVQAHSR